jgi:hypothetical protein
VHRLLVVLVVLLTGCSAGTDPDAAAPPAVSEAPSAPSAASPAPSARTLEVTFAGGEITGVDSRVDVAVGEQVVLRVTSDVVEEIHVHGYDLYADLAPGQPATLSFTADLPGSYEVELHDAGRPLFQLRVA